MRSLHSQSATVNIATGATVLSHTVTTATALTDLILEVGDGTSNLGAAAETTLTVAITVAGVPIRGSDPTETVEAGRTRLRIPVDTFPVALGETVEVTLTSDQPADTAVAVTATLRDASPLQPVTRGRQVKADADGLVELTSASTELVATAVSDQADIAGLISDWVDGGRLDLILDTINSKAGLITASSVSVVSPVAADGTTITVIQGDDYSGSRAIIWTGSSVDQWPDLTGATLAFRATMMGALPVEAVPTVTTPTGTQVLTMSLTDTHTDTPIGRYRYDVEATLSGGDVVTLLRGAFVVQRTYTNEP